MSDALLGLVGSAALASFVLVAPGLEVLPARFRGWLASLSGGAGLAYVFLYLLFELATEGAEKIHELVPLGPAPLETLFMVLLVAIAATYLLEMRFEATTDSHDDFWHYASLFGSYNLLAGVGLVEEARWGVVNLAFYVAALGLHVLFNDRFLGHVSAGMHNWRWRGVFASAPIVGAALAIAFNLPLGVLYAVLALVAGGTIINVLRRELPAVTQFRPLAFVAGVAVYAALILATWRF